MRSYIKDHKKDVLLTVHNLPAGTPVKLAVMDRFDGTVWNLSDSSEATDSSNYHRVGTTIKADEQGKSFTATFTVDQELTDTWLPLAGASPTMPTTAMTRFTTTRIPIPPLFPPARVKASPIPNPALSPASPPISRSAVRLRPASPNQKPRMFPIRPANWPRPLPAGSPRAGPQPRRWLTH